ncbi:putative phage abortive infection protein, partial [Aliivibrio fischeri]|uniref:putative phage abortive infection protein n=1 Tax=Aliivibrio fischeri TaxID=668 RepID=UPI00037949FB
KPKARVIAALAESEVKLRNQSIILIIVGAIIVSCVPLALYGNIFQEFSEEHQRWGEFGSFVGGTSGTILSLLAFIGLFISIRQTDYQHKLQSEESVFYNLLNFQISKVNDIELNDNKGPLVFKVLNQSYKNLYVSHCRKLAISMLSDLDKLPPELLQFLEDEFEAFNQKGLKFRDVINASENKNEFLKSMQIRSKVKFNEIFNLKSTLIMERATSEDRIKNLKEIYTEFYHAYGYIVGPYFRNMYYILEHAERASESVRYSKILRAQLSRYELTLIYYNLMSKYTSNDFNLLLNKYNMLNGIYEPDVCYSPTKEVLISDLRQKFS